MKLFKSNKKKDPTAEKQLQKNLTANEFVNVKDIDGTIVYTKDNKLYCYIKIKPFSLELLSEDEQKLRGRQFTANFRQLPSHTNSFQYPAPWMCHLCWIT